MMGVVASLCCCDVADVLFSSPLATDDLFQAQRWKRGVFRHRGRTDQLRGRLWGMDEDIVATPRYVTTATTFNGKILFGGHFERCDQLRHSQYMVLWDPASQTWEEFPEQLNGQVNHFLWHAGELYAAGRFTGGVVKWDTINQQWQPVGNGGFTTASGATQRWPYKLIWFRDDLYAIGAFARAGNELCRNIARLVDGQWQPVGVRPDPDDESEDPPLINGVYTSTGLQGLQSAAVFDDKLIVGAYQQPTLASDDVIGSLIALDNETFTEGTIEIINGVVTLTAGEAIWPHWAGNAVLTVDEVEYEVAERTDDATLLLADTNVNIDAESTYEIKSIDIFPAIYAGDVTSSSGNNAIILDLTVHENQLIVAGTFDAVDGDPASNIARYSGSAWDAMDDGVAEPVASAIDAGGDLIIAPTNGTPQVWSPSIWSDVHTVGDGLQWSFGQRATLLEHDGVLYMFAQGRIELDHSILQTARLDRIEGRWRMMGYGHSGEVFALVRYNDEVIVGGDFNRIGGIDADRLAVFRDGIWQAMSMPGAAAGDPVYGLKVINIAIGEEEEPSPHLFAVGAFGDFANRVAWFDDEEQEWLDWGGTAFHESVFATDLVMYQEVLYVFGSFGVRRWVDGDWEHVLDDEGDPITVDGGNNLFDNGNPSRRAVVLDDVLYMAGSVVIGSPITVWKWDGNTAPSLPGESASVISPGANSPTVFDYGTDFVSEMDLCSVGGKLYLAGGDTATGAGHWHAVLVYEDEQWVNPAGNVLSGQVSQLAEIDGELYAGGTMTLRSGDSMGEPVGSVLARPFIARLREGQWETVLEHEGPSDERRAMRLIDFAAG